MTDRPIIFSAPMVRALLAARKTQTRRILRQQTGISIWRGQAVEQGDDGVYRPVRVRFQTGDRLWVREAWALWHGSRDGEDWWPARSIPSTDPRIDDDARGASCVDYPVGSTNGGTDAGKGPWRPSIHMPRWASRLTLTVTDMRVQRLQDISDDDARAEGVDPVVDHGAGNPHLHKIAFEHLWNHLHDPDAWAANPWVVALTFTVTCRNIDSLEPK